MMNAEHRVRLCTVTATIALFVSALPGVAADDRSKTLAQELGALGLDRYINSSGWSIVHVPAGFFQCGLSASMRI